MSNSNTTSAILFVTRNKDNKNVPGFKESRKSFLSDKYVHELMSDFDAFCAEHPNETCRFYQSVNTRDDAKVKKSLMHYLIDNDCPTWKLPQVVTRLATRPENRDTRRVLIDVDFKMTDEQLNAMINDLNSQTIVAFTNETPNGMHIIIEQGFYYKPFVEKWSKFGTVEIKNDAMYLVAVRNG